MLLVTPLGGSWWWSTQFKTARKAKPCRDTRPRSGVRCKPGLSIFP
jgi:hypothetical protein